MSFSVVVLILAGAAVVLGLSMVKDGGRAGRSRPRGRELVAELARQAQIAIRSQGWQRFPEGAVIVERAVWTGADLLQALNRLLEAIDAEFRERSQRGSEWRPGAFYDAGLQVIQEALRQGRDG